MAVIPRRLHPAPGRPRICLEHCAARASPPPPHCTETACPPARHASPRAHRAACSRAPCCCSAAACSRAARPRCSAALGTLVTGSGPHAGDAAAKRFGFDPRTVSFLHADVVIAFCGLALAIWLALRLTHADRRLINSAQLVLASIIIQGAIGYTQYFTKLPEALVALHLLGADVVWISTCLLYARIKRAGVETD